MKYNKWTLVLAAAGVVTAPSLVLAANPNQVLTAVESTTLSGYVDTSAHWNLGTGNNNVPKYYAGAGKADGFNLNVVDLALEKAQDESPWASGYKVELWAGPDATALGTAGSFYGPTSYGSSGQFAVRQAYVSLRTPIGNGIDWKIGVFDTIVGYEGLSSPNNPNYTHSYGFGIEPTTHTGILGSYKVCDSVSFSAGVANTAGPLINERNVTTSGGTIESYKSYLGSVTFTAPKDMGFLSGSTLTGGVVNGFNSGSIAGVAEQVNYYVGATLNTPVTSLKVGASYDYAGVGNQALTQANPYANATSVYLAYQATEKLALNLREEYASATSASYFSGARDHGRVVGTTVTAAYDLWKNVVSRAEFRWDHTTTGVNSFGSGTGESSYSPNRENAFLVAANIIYKF